MRFLFPVFMLCLSCVSVANAQNDAFHGTWKVDLAKSSGSQLPKQEFVILNVSGGVEHGTNDIISADGTVIKDEYKAKYNDGQWYPTKSLATGKESGSKALMIRMDPRSELRVMQGPDGKAGGVIMRVVSEDGKTMKITVLTMNGEILQTLFLDKQPDGSRRP